MRFYNIKFLAVIITISFQLCFGSNKAFALDSQDWANIIDIGNTLINGGSNSNDSVSSLECDVNSDEGDIDVNGDNRNRFPCMDNLNTMCFTEKATGGNGLALYACKVENKKKLIVDNVNVALHKIVSEPVNKREKEASRFLKNRMDALNQAKRQPMHDPLRKHTIHQIAMKKFDVCTLEYAILRFRHGKLQDWDPDKESSSNSVTNQPTKSSQQQATTSQSNQSSSGDLSKMSSGQLVDLINSAQERGDYAQAYAAEQQMAKDPNPKMSRQALRGMGVRFAEGKGVKQNLSEAHRLFQQAASMGDLDASSNLCTFNIFGEGIPENHTKALEYCLAAAEKGHKRAQASLGYLYESGNGIQRNPQLSNEWTCKAAAQGEPIAVSNVKKAKISCN